MLYIHLLGHLRLFIDEQPLQFSALPKTLPMWAYLLLNRANPLPRDTLAFLLWPDTSEQAARANLRRHLYDLRRVLPSPSPEHPWLLSRAGTLQWNPNAGYWLDVAEFERLSTSPEHLDRAIALYSDDLLPDVYEDLIAPHRERLHSLYLNGLSRLIAKSRAQGNLAQAATYAQQLLGHDPLHEDTVRELIGLYYQAGDRTGALQAYRQFEQRLREELDISPMPETQALYDAVQRHAPLPDISPPLPVAPSPPPHNLPALLNTFVGRTPEMDTLCHLLSAAELRARLFTLTGPAGAGKTRLALEVTTRLLSRPANTFPDGIFFVDLSPIDKPELVAPAIAETLGVKEKGELPLLEGLKAHLRSKYMLLLLDNFEQVVAAGPQIVDLLAAAPNLRILVTSRTVLRVYGEHEYAVRPLPVPNLEHPPPTEVLLENAAVALFLDRARERKPNLAPTEQDLAAVAEICARLEGLPLALELAASRVKAFSPATILERLANRLDFLTNGARDLPTRQQTLRGALDWSCHLLNKREKNLFAVLGVFAGGCTLQAIETICRPFCEGDLLNTLAALVDNSLIQQYEQNDKSRFGMASTIREYALEHLEKKGLSGRAHQHHANYYTDLAEQARSVWATPQQAAWMKRLRAEDDNLRAAMDWSLAVEANAEQAQFGARLIYALWGFWEGSGRLSEARAWHRQGLAHLDLLPPKTQVHLLNGGGWFAQLQGEYQVADSYYQQALAVAQRVQDPSLQRFCLHCLGTMAGRQGDYGRAGELLEQAITLERKISGGVMTRQLAGLLNNLAIVAKHQGDYDRAAALLHESLDYKRAQGDQLGVAISLTNLGNLALLLKDYVQTEAHFRESLLLRQALGDQKGVLTLLPGLTELAMAQGRPSHSVCLYSACIALRQAYNYPLTSEEESKYAHYMAALEEQLGEAEFATAWATGKSMTLDQVVDLILGAESSPS